VDLPEDVNGHPPAGVKACPPDANGQPNTVGKDCTDDLGYFYAGHQHLNGAAALRLARIRKNYTVFKRADDQTLVLCALKDKLTTSAVLPKMPQIAQSFLGSVQTDLSPAEISQLACLLPKLSRENLMFASVPQELFKQGRTYDPQQKGYTFTWDIDRQVLQGYINRFLSGEWPQPSADNGPTCPPEQP
jgi:anionic cell wall polymer biosynthesis LytR-Cps2A-Psr (LCP) family protein